MAKAKKEVQRNQPVQGRPDPLDRLLAIAADVAARAGLLDQDLLELRSRRQKRGGRSEDDRRSA